MTPYETPSALRRALEDRLLASVRREGGDIQRLRRQTAFDRLLCRLFHEPNPPWLLKGGYAMELRIQAARTTRDIELGNHRRHLPASRHPCPADLAAATSVRLGTAVCRNSRRVQAGWKSGRAAPQTCRLPHPDAPDLIYHKSRANCGPKGLLKAATDNSGPSSESPSLRQAT
jgi:hypothetical protein